MVKSEIKVPKTRGCTFSICSIIVSFHEKRHLCSHNAGGSPDERRGFWTKLHAADTRRRPIGGLGTRPQPGCRLGYGSRRPSGLRWDSDQPGCPNIWADLAGIPDDGAATAMLWV